MDGRPETSEVCPVYRDGRSSTAARRKTAGRLKYVRFIGSRQPGKARRFGEWSKTQVCPVYRYGRPGYRRLDPETDRFGGTSSRIRVRFDDRRDEEIEGQVCPVCREIAPKTSPTNPVGAIGSIATVGSTRRRFGKKSSIRVVPALWECPEKAPRVAQA